MFGVKRARALAAALLVFCCCSLDLAATAVAGPPPPRVRVESGELSGTITHTFAGRPLYSFLGVPYASPPVHKNRFRVSGLQRRIFGHILRVGVGWDWVS